MANPDIYILDIETLSFEDETIDPKLICIYALPSNSAVRTNNVRTIKPGSHVIFDLQTNGPDFISIAVSFITSTPGIFLAHNGTKFDFPLLSLLDHIHYHPNLSRNTIMTAYINSSRTTSIVDSLTILPFALHTLGTKTSLDFSQMKHYDSPTHSAFRAQCISYCLNDCKILGDFVARILRITHKSKLRINSVLTIGHLTNHLYNSDPKNTKIYKFDKPEDDLVYRRYYYGGIVHCSYQPYVSPHTYSIDINSAYPYVMSSHHLANGFPIPTDPYYLTANTDPTILNRVPHRKPSDLLTNLNTFITLEADFHNPYIQIIFKSKHKPYYIRTLYPKTGRYRINITLGELRQALFHKRLSNVSIIHSTSFTTISLSNFISNLYTSRLKAKTLLDNKIYKILMNSMYGYQGMNAERHREHIPFSEYSEEQLAAIRVAPALQTKRLGNKTYHVVPPPEKSYKNVAFASSVTAGARILLRILLYANSTPTSAGSILYCDTDCIHTSSPPSLSIFSRGSSLGQVKNEIINKKVWYGGKKSYFIYGATRPKLKGASLSPDDYKQIIETNGKCMSIPMPKIKQQPEGHFEAEYLQREIRVTDNTHITNELQEIASKCVYDQYSSLPVLNDVGHSATPDPEDLLGYYDMPPEDF